MLSRLLEVGERILEPLVQRLPYTRRRAVEQVNADEDVLAFVQASGRAAGPAAQRLNAATDAAAIRLGLVRQGKSTPRRYKFA